MLTVKLVCVGKLKEKFYSDAVAEYSKRLSLYCRLEIDEVREERLPGCPAPAETETALFKEASNITDRIPKGAAVIAMCIEGMQTDSAGFSGLLSKYASDGISKLCFVIGGSYGLDEKFKENADMRLSMSKMTFPHHLARVMLLEQLYRGFKIEEGGKYHK